MSDYKIVTQHLIPTFTKDKQALSNVNDIKMCLDSLVEIAEYIGENKADPAKYAEGMGLLSRQMESLSNAMKNYSGYLTGYAYSFGKRIGVHQARPGKYFLLGVVTTLLCTYGYSKRKEIHKLIKQYLGSE